MIFLKSMLHKLLFAGRFYDGIRYVTRRYPLILVYHRFGPGLGGGKYLGSDVLTRQMKHIRKKCNLISLKQLYEITKNNDPIPARSVVLTVDDGYADFYRYALPVFRKYEAPVTLFAVSDFIDQKIWLWPDLIEYIIMKTKRSDYTARLNGLKQQYHISDQIHRHKAWSDFADHALSMSDSDCREFIKALSDDLDVIIPDLPADDFRAMTWQQLKEIRKHTVEVGSHTATHPRLTRVTESQLAQELDGSKKKIEQNIDAAVNAFCYPFGRKVDIDNGVKFAVERAGYQYATIGYFNLSVTADPFELKRLGVNNNHNEFIKKIYGWEILKTFILNRQFDR